MTDDQSTHDQALTEPGLDAGQGSACAPPDGQAPGAGTPAPVPAGAASGSATVAPVVFSYDDLVAEPIG